MPLPSATASSITLLFDFKIMNTKKIANFWSQLPSGSFDFELFPMDMQSVKKGVLDYTKKKKRLISILAALGFSSYAAYRVYHLPSITRKRKRISNLLGALISIAEAVSDSAETIGVISKDLKDFLQSESDQIPNSLKQISKVAKSSEFSDSVICLTQALTLGILRGYQSSSRIDYGSTAANNSSFLDKVFDKLSTPAGSGFVSVIVGSFARNLVMALYQDGNSSTRELNSNSDLNSVGLEINSVTKYVDVVCGHKGKELIGDCIQLFVSTAVAVYLDKTMHINTYDEIFAGLTNPKHEKKVREVLVSVCNGAVETLVKTSHQVLTSTEAKSRMAIDQREVESENMFLENEASKDEPEARNSFDEVEDGGWIDKVSSTLAVPSNRRLVLDLTGRVTFETVRSFLEFLVEKIYEGIKKCADVVYEAVVGSSLGVVRYVTAKSSVIATICLSLCLHIMDSSWILMPA
ncbi:protein PHLOEM PROTEIN 2-LIKE A10 isoform X2 [Jatropha curcas]|uniref:protein PHLOEM PROTEIN 2-LIKE A10 isoform X2 n=1 Tax=Jatropha curcas TaxID=180498 RepID=UPI0005FC14BD|nr:protein PHLOEM PROTEIN 2-LIKE A10 isoform X2 [Jatropha curcas]